MSLITAAAFLPRKPCQSGQWHDAAFTLAAPTGATPDAKAAQPVRHTSGVVLVADCRLDNGDELAADLLASNNGPHADRDLILAAWLRWGVDCASHLLGDFAFALWDPRQRLLFCATDPFGCRPLFYASIGKGVVVSSDPALIVAHPDFDKSIDAAWLAQILARTSGAGLDTPFSALKHLPGGHSLIVKEGCISERTYWKPQPGSLHGLGTERAIIEEGRHLLSAAVACRLRSSGTVGAELTGGLDSSGVVATALPVLRAKGEDLPVFSRLRAASHAFLGPDESAGVASLCQHIGLERRFVSTCTGPGLLELLNGVLDQYAIPLCPWSVFSEEMRLLAAGQGVRTMLSGFAGDNCFSAAESNLPATAPRRLDWHWRWDHQYALARHYGNGRRIKPFAGALLATVAPRLNGLRIQLTVGSASDDSVLEPIMAAREFRDQSIARARAEQRRFRALRGDVRATLLRNRQLQFRIASSALLARRHQQVWTYPLLDRRLIEFALACPPHIRTANGFSRRLARLIVADRLPASIAWKPSKGREIIPGAREQVIDNGDAIRARLEGWRRHPMIPHVFDLNRALAALQPPSPEAAAPWVASACGIVDVLQLGAFLERHADAALHAVATLRANVTNAEPSGLGLHQATLE